MYGETRTGVVERLPRRGEDDPLDGPRLGWMLLRVPLFRSPQSDRRRDWGGAVEKDLLWEASTTPQGSLGTGRGDPCRPWRASSSTPKKESSRAEPFSLTHPCDD